MWRSQPPGGRSGFWQVAVLVLAGRSPVAQPTLEDDGGTRTCCWYTSSRTALCTPPILDHDHHCPVSEIMSVNQAMSWPVTTTPP
jgi:hypothetical protein